LDAIEKAIRNAFEKGNAEDRAFREKVYRSAFAALDRALQANPGITVESAINRRKAMQAKIAEIESEFLPAVSVPAVDAEGRGADEPPAVEPPAARAAGAPSIDAPSSAPSVGPALERPLAGSSPAVSRSSGSSASGAPEPVLDQPAVAANGSHHTPTSAEVAPDRDERRARRRRFPLAAAFLGATVLAIVGIGLWWVVQSGLVRTGQPPARAGDQAAVPPAGTTEQVTPGGSDQGREWIIVFSPADPTLVSAPSDAKADVMKDDTGSFLRVRSGASGSAVNFDVGQGILQQVAGKHAVFDIIARAEEGKDTQMSIDCNFGELGDCGRKRYAVSHVKNEYLFDVQFPDKSAGAAGGIAINSDFDGEGKSVDIYEIRVSVDE
jgi:hypothetical protein